MTPHINRQWRLVRRPVGMVTTGDFTLAEVPVPQPRENECLVRVLYVSFDPAMRAFLHDRPSYVPPQPIGDVMRAGALAQVVESRAAGLQPGDIVQGAFGWQEYAAATIPAAAKIVPRFPLPHYMSVLGGTGLTAYVGLMEVGRLVPGETVLISGAAGATGSSAAQIARLKGCRTIGIAGGAAKCEWLLRDLRLDAAIDYKRDDVGARLSELCPDGVNLYFDNVGGSTLETAIGRMALHGRIVCCGMISEYNAERPPAGPSNLFELISRRIRMEGFLLFDYVSQFDRGRRELEAWLDAGELRAYVDVQEGFENIPATFMRIFSGANTGKQLLKVAEPL